MRTASCGAVSGEIGGGIHGDAALQHGEMEMGADGLLQQGRAAHGADHVAGADGVAGGHGRRALQRGVAQLAAVAAAAVELARKK